MFYNITRDSARALGVSSEMGTLFDGRPYEGLPLYHHQITTTNAMRLLETARSGSNSGSAVRMTSYDCGVLASPPGAGKTLSTVVLSALHPTVEVDPVQVKQKSTIITCLNGRAFRQETQTFDHIVDGTLFVVPAQLFAQWKDCINRMAKLPEGSFIGFAQFGKSEMDYLRKLYSPGSGSSSSSALSSSSDGTNADGQHMQQQEQEQGRVRPCKRRRMLPGSIDTASVQNGSQR